MQLLGSRPAGEFLKQNWQKRPLFLKHAFESLAPELSPNELAWLATLPDVESKLVFTESSDRGTRYRVEQGPFDEARLESLPEQDWTLLVQDVDKHLPEFRELVTAVDVIPDWRVDDLMISFASPGGSVGPHLDNYDVFLCQGIGIREWRLADAKNAVAATEKSDLRLLEPFESDLVHEAEPGDVLYLPPGVPHWGVASESCMTYSIGMRAPETTEFRLAAERLYPGYAPGPEQKGCRFYQDADLGADEAAPGQVSVASLERARRSFPGFNGLSEPEMAQTFGSVVTDPKAWLAPDRLKASRDSRLIIHGMARLAWYENADTRLIFANGFSRRADSSELAGFQSLCSASRTGSFSISGSGLEGLSGWLCEHGVFDLEAAP